jgi:hypothetical protein
LILWLNYGKLKVVSAGRGFLCLPIFVDSMPEKKGSA